MAGDPASLEGVTAANLGDDTPGAVGASAPRALISRNALLHNAAALGDAPADLRRDAWGHGLEEVAELLVSVGISRARVDAGAAEVAARMGLTPVLDGPAEGERLYGSAAGAAPVMTLRGTVLACKALRAGEGVSYGFAHRASQDTRVALVTGGYAQGVVRALGGRASVLVDGRRFPIVGRVAMDVCMLDIGDADIPRSTDATFFGDPAAGASSIAEWASATGMSAAELLTAVGLRASREWIA